MSLNNFKNVILDIGKSNSWIRRYYPSIDIDNIVLKYKTQTISSNYDISEKDIKNVIELLESYNQICVDKVYEVDIILQIFKEIKNE